jgi:IS605 OrfB family transposase
MWYTIDVDIQRCVTILLPPDADLRATLDVFRDLQNKVSAAALGGGTPLRAVELQRAVYHAVKGRLSSQMTITALRLVAGAYASAKRNRARRLRAEERRKKRCAAKGRTYTPRTISPLRLCRFERPAALFLVGQRGRDADFRADGTLSIWTVGGRKHLPYTIPTALRPLVEAAKEIDSVTVIERGGRLYGRVALTLEAPEPKGVVPVGIDLNETNAVVAVDAAGREFWLSGKDIKVRNKRTAQTWARVQRKLATKKAEKRDRRSVQRLLKRLSGRRRRRTQDFARVAAKQLLAWAPADAVLVFEDLRVPRPQKGLTRGTALRRRLALWQYAAIRTAAQNKAQMAGIAVAFVNPAYTSKVCSRCGLVGRRRRHLFTCPHCGYCAHADVNAATNVRHRFVQLRLDAASSAAAEALPTGEGKPKSFSFG